MRKRRVIAAIAAAAIVVAACVVARLEDGTVDYHEKQYRKIRQTTFVDRLVFTRGPQWLRQKWLNRRHHRLAHHHDVLLRQGYFQEHVFFISNQPPLKLIRAVHAQAPFTTESFSRVTGMDTNSITVLTSADEMPAWETLLRKLDVPD